MLFLLFQVGMIVHARFDPARYWCWAPHDQQAEYWIDVEIDGRSLPPEQVARRYRDPWGGIEPRTIEHVIRLVRQYEQTYGRDDGARVVLRYRTNGGPLRVWRWPAA